MAPETAAHVYVGVELLSVPLGPRRVGARGVRGRGTALPAGGATANSKPSLQGPGPVLFQARTHQRPVPGARRVFGVTAQVPVPAAHPAVAAVYQRSEEHTSELQSRLHLVCRLL